MTSDEMHPILPDHLDKVCLLGKGEATCSFIARDHTGWVCAKGSSIQSAIDARREAKTLVAMGDNCSGPPAFSQNPTVVVQPFCDRHRRDLLQRRLKIAEDGPWLVHELTVQILCFTWASAHPAVYARSGGETDALSLILAEIGCLACFDHDGYLRAITLLRKGIDHAALVARHQATDPDWPIDDRIAALKNGAP